MNRVNGVYERDVDIHMNIVANNNKIAYAANNTLGSGTSVVARVPALPRMILTLMGTAQPCLVRTRARAIP